MFFFYTYIETHTHTLRTAAGQQHRKRRIKHFSLVKLFEMQATAKRCFQTYTFLCVCVWVKFAGTWTYTMDTTVVFNFNFFLLTYLVFLAFTVHILWLTYRKRANNYTRYSDLCNDLYVRWCVCVCVYNVPS